MSCGAPLRRARANATAQGRSQSAAALTRAGARTRTPATETKGTSRAPTCPVSGALARLNLRGTGALRAEGKPGVVTRGFGGASRRDPSRAARVVARKAASRAARSSRSGFVRPRRSRRASSRGRGRASVASHRQESRSLENCQSGTARHFPPAAVPPSSRAGVEVRRGRPARVPAPAQAAPRATPSRAEAVRALASARAARPHDTSPRRFPVERRGLREFRPVGATFFLGDAKTRKREWRFFVIASRSVN